MLFEMSFPLLLPISTLVTVIKDVARSLN